MFSDLIMEKSLLSISQECIEFTGPYTSRTNSVCAMEESYFCRNGQDMLYSRRYRMPYMYWVKAIQMMVYLLNKFFHKATERASQRATVHTETLG